MADRGYVIVDSRGLVASVEGRELWFNAADRERADSTAASLGPKLHVAAIGDERYPDGRGYVNQGPDRRAGGALGQRLAKAQRDLSFKSPTSPRKTLERHGDTLVEITTAPNGKQHIAIAIPRRNRRWDTFRFGWRYDANWGDENVQGFNPDPEIVGGYIADVVIKLNSTSPFIELPS